MNISQESIKPQLTDVESDLQGITPRVLEPHKSIESPFDEIDYSGKNDDLDSLFYGSDQDVIKPPSRIVMNSNQANKVPILPESKKRGPELKSMYSENTSRLWKIHEIKSESQRVLNDFEDVTGIIRTKFITPVDDVAYHILPECITKELTTRDLEVLIRKRVRELCILCGGSGNMVPELKPEKLMDK
eukprot:UN29413